MSDANNGLLTKIWGPSAWEYLHSVTFGYPVEPNSQQKKEYKDFFTLIGSTLPCCYCRDSYAIFIKEDDTLLNDKVLENRESLTNWFYKIHEKVNKKLEVNYLVTFEDVKKRYESYRAVCDKHNKEEKGCVMPLNKKALSYKISYLKDCLVIPFEITQKFINYAKDRGVNINNFELITKLKTQNDYDNFINNKNTDDWYKRNYNCCNIIKNMRISAIPAIESEGKWKGLPTFSELSLILNFSSNLNNNQLQEMLCKVDPLCRGYKKKYRLIY
jgi:hypothetical protein